MELGLQLAVVNIGTSLSTSPGLQFPSCFKDRVSWLDEVVKTNSLSTYCVSHMVKRLSGSAGLVVFIWLSIEDQGSSTGLL